MVAFYMTARKHGRFFVCRSNLWDIAAEDPGESGRIMGGLATGRAGLQAVAIK